MPVANADKVTWEDRGTVYCGVVEEPKTIFDGKAQVRVTHKDGVQLTMSVGVSTFVLVSQLAVVGAIDDPR
jgi:hypothetical protein